MMSAPITMYKMYNCITNSNTSMNLDFCICLCLKSWCPRIHHWIATYLLNVHNTELTPRLRTQKSYHWFGLPMSPWYLHGMLVAPPRPGASVLAMTGVGDGRDAMMPMGTKSWINFSPWFKNLSLFLLRCFFLKVLRFQTVSWNLALFKGRGRLRWEPGCPPQGVHPSSWRNLNSMFIPFHFSRHYKTMYWIILDLPSGKRLYT